MIENLSLGFQGWDHPEWAAQAPSAEAGITATLGRYSKRFQTVEMDDTFYGVPPSPLVERWHDSVPRDFKFALKAPQQITHEQGFAANGGLLKKFLSRVELLGDKLGPILLLAPPAFGPDEESWTVLRDFVNELPREFTWAIEMRHAGWLTQDLRDLLGGKNVSLVIGENRWIRRSLMTDLTLKPTADFSYVRWNGGTVANPHGDRADRDGHVTATWVKTLERLSGAVKAVYGYFHVNAFGDGLRSADELQYSVGQQWLEASVAGEADTPIN